MSIDEGLRMSVCSEMCSNKSVRNSFRTPSVHILFSSYNFFLMVHVQRICVYFALSTSETIVGLSFYLFTCWVPLWERQLLSLNCVVSFNITLSPQREHRQVIVYCCIIEIIHLAKFHSSLTVQKDPRGPFRKFESPAQCWAMFIAKLKNLIQFHALRSTPHTPYNTPLYKSHGTVLNAAILISLSLFFPKTKWTGLTTRTQRSASSPGSAASQARGKPCASESTT